MMHGRGKSDEAIVAVKPTNKAERSAAELVERRAEAKGNARHQSMLRTLCRVQHVTRDGRMRIIVYLMMRSDPLPQEMQTALFVRMRQELTKLLKDGRVVADWTSNIIVGHA